MAETSTTVRSSNSALAAGDTELTKSLLADGIEWINVLPWDQPDKDDLELLSPLVAQILAERYSKGWTFQLKSRGLIDVTQCVIFPFLEEGQVSLPLPSIPKGEWQSRLARHSDNDRRTNGRAKGSCIRTCLGC